MSLAFNDTSTYKGIVQGFELEIGANLGDISGNTTRLKQFTAQANSAFDDYFSIALPASGTWKLDDSNHTDFPEMTTDLVAGQREYLFTTDEQGNLILDIYRVYANTGSGFYLLNPVDKDSEDVDSSFYNGLSSNGNPTSYDKTGNAIILNLDPLANVTDGLKVSINREASYFTHSDTTKKAGVPSLHHKWFYLRPALDYARRNSLASYPRIEAEVMKMEQDIKSYFSKRTRDEKPRLKVNVENNR